MNYLYVNYLGLGDKYPFLDDNFGGSERDDHEVHTQDLMITETPNHKVMDLSNYRSGIVDSFTTSLGYSILFQNK